MKLKIFALALLMSCVQVASAQVAAPRSTISIISSYTYYGDGDVIVTLSSPIEQCDGYWMVKADKGYTTNLAMLLSAFQTKMQIQVYGVPTNLWPGSTRKFCKLYSIDFIA